MGLVSLSLSRQLGPPFIEMTSQWWRNLWRMAVARTRQSLPTRRRCCSVPCPDLLTMGAAPSCRNRGRPAHAPARCRPAAPPALAGGLDGEAVVVGERGRFRMQRYRRTRRHVPLDHRLGAVIDQHCRRAAEVGERPPVAVEKRAQIRAGHKAAERSRDHDKVMWSEYTLPIPTWDSTPPSSPQSTCPCAPGVTSNRRCNPASASSSPAPSSAATLGRAWATHNFTH